MAIPTFNGEAIPVVTVEPNWQQGVTLRTRYKTTIAEAIDLTEERQSLAPRCLYGLEYQSLTLTSQETGYLKRMLDLAEDKPIGVPLWPMATRLSASASTSATTLTVDDTDNCLFDVFYEHAILWESFLKWEVVELNVVSQFSVTLLAGISQGYSAKAKLIPLAYGSLSRESLNGSTDANSEWTCTFDEVFHNLNDQSIPEDEPVSLQPFDSMESYTDLVLVNDLNGGEAWPGPYVDSSLPFGQKQFDDIESYTNSASLNGLNGGAWSAGAYVDR